MNTIKINASQLSKKAKSPVYDYCRKLIKEGVDPNTRLEVYRGHPDPDFAVPNIGEGAKLTIRENDWDSATVIVYESFATNKIK